MDRKSIISRNKGVRAQQKSRLNQMKELRNQGLSWNKIAKMYKLDKNNVRRAVLKTKTGGINHEKVH